MLLNQQNTQFQLKQVPVPLTSMRAQLSCTIKRKNGSSHMNDVSSKCVFCNGQHKLDMSVGFGTFGEARRTTDCQMYLKEGHRSRNCKQNKYYSIQYSHPTLLHDDSRESKGNTTFPSCTDSKISFYVGNVHVSENIHSLMIPVLLYHKDEPEKIIIAYALLDKQI